MVLSRDQLRGGWCSIYLLRGWVGVDKSDDMPKMGSVLVLCAFFHFQKLNTKAIVD